MKVFIACASNEDINKVYYDLAEQISENLAIRGFDLFYGAASYSMMGICYKVFTKHKRKVYAYTVPKYKKDLKKLPKATCVLVPDTLLRFRKLYFKSDLIVILPGGIGTLAEFAAALEEYRTSGGNKKIILVNYNHYFDTIIKWLKEAQRKKFINKDLKDCYSVVSNLEEFNNAVDNYLNRNA